jgi:uncharacterized membrane protein/protein-disulfide isomerase
MTGRARYALIALAALGLIASCAALYVHYRLMTEPDYSSFCDINATVSCQQVFQSQYGSVLGIPVAAGGAIWALLVLMLSTWGLREPKSESASRVAGYIFVLSTLGLAAVFYFAYVSFFVLGHACPLCMTMYVSVVGTFLVSAGVAGPLAALPSRLGSDVAVVVRSPVAVTLAAVWLAVSAGLILGFPKDQVAQAASGAASAQSLAPVETLTPEQRAEWEAWLDAQPRSQEAMPQGATKVLVLKFNDYQCPSCRQAWVLYKDIIAKYEKSHPGVFKAENRDFPLETECGAGNAGHVVACEAAAAVRMARAKNRDKDLEAALFERQSISMTRDEVKNTLQEVAQISGSDFDAKYASVLQDIRADVQLGQKLGVKGTPTFFLNGIQLPSLRPAYFDAAIEWALRKSGASS